MIEATCAGCNRVLKKVTERPIKNYNWSCDCCEEKFLVKPGFEFYSCKKCRMDWCNKPECMAKVEHKTIVPRKADTSIIFNPSFFKSRKTTFKSKKSTFYGRKSSKAVVIDDFSSINSGL